MVANRTTKAPSNHRLLKAVVAVLTFLAVVGIPLWYETPLQARACESASVGDVVRFACEDKYSAISLGDASPFLQLFVARWTAGAGPRESWDMYSADYRQANDYTAFAAGMSKLFWAETVGPIRPTSTFATFDFTYRNYVKGDANNILAGQVQALNMEVKLEREDGQLAISDSTDLGRAASPQLLTFPRPILEGAENVYQLPRLSSTVNEYVATPGHPGDIQVGGLLTALCNLVVDPAAHPLESPLDQGLWVRTPQGWIPKADLTFTPGASGAAVNPIPDVPDCDPAVMDRR